MQSPIFSKKPARLFSIAALIIVPTTAHAQNNYLVEHHDIVKHYQKLSTRVLKSDDTVLELFSFVDGFAWETENKKKISYMLLNRIDTLDDRYEGINVTFPPVTSAAKEGPPKVFKTDKYIQYPTTPKRMKKKVCKSGGWDAAGYAQGAYGRALENQLSLAQKKCLKHKIVLDVDAYTEGHKRGLREYCGYERGLFIAAHNLSSGKNCSNSSYDAGVRHGQQKRPYYVVSGSIYKDSNLIKNMYSSLAKARRGIPSGTEEPHIYTRHEYILDEDSVRSQRDRDALEDFKAQHPLVLTAPTQWKYIRKDADLDYPIPG